MSNKNLLEQAILGLIAAIPIAIIILKCVGIITWVWLWVLAPIWIPFAIGVIATIIFALRTDPEDDEESDHDRSWIP